MRLTRLFGMSLLGSLAIAGCSSDGGGKTLIDAPKLIDAAMIDAAPVCTVPATISALGLGTAQAPITNNFVRKTTSGMIFFGIAAYLPPDMVNGMDIIVPRPTAGFTTGTFTFDSNPNSAAPVALSFLEGNINPSTMDPEKTLWAMSGSVTLTAIGQTANAPITGTVSATMYREVDSAGADVPSGCKSTLAGLSFFLKQQTAVTIEPDTSPPANWRNEKLTTATAQPLVSE